MMLKKTLGAAVNLFAPIQAPRVTTITRKDI